MRAHHSPSGPARRRPPGPPLALALALAIGACAQPRDAEPPRDLRGAAAGRHVVIISIDTLRADRLGAYGYGVRATSPAIDSLLARGVRYERAHSPRSLTWPALASMLTGLYPSAHGLIYNGYELPDALPTLPRLLAARGYRTGAFLSNMCQANHQGWNDFSCAGGVDARATRRALEWLEANAASGQPLLLWVHLFGPHPPYYNGGERARLELDPGYSGPLAPKKGVLDRVMTEPIELGDADIRHLDALYDAAVMGTDHYVAELVAGVERALDPEETLIVLLADHGEDLYQHHRYLYHACSVYETSLHVPLGIVAPGLLDPALESRHVELVDVLPTLLELLDIPAPGCTHGRSLLAQTPTRPSGVTGTALGEYGDTSIHTWVSGRWKLVSNPDGVVPECMKGAPVGHYPIGAVELYDLLQDPNERHDLAEQQSAVVGRLEREMTERIAGLCAPSAESAAPGRQAVSDELRRQLEELGYVVDDTEGVDETGPPGNVRQ